MPMQRRSGDLQESYEYDDDDKDEWSDNIHEKGIICITPPVGYKPKNRAGHSPVYLSKVILQRFNRPTCPSESQRAREVFRRYEERRNVARQMLKTSPVPSSSLPRGIIKSRIQGEYDYSSDFTEDEDDASWVRSASRRIVTNETSSGGEEVLTSPDEEIQLLMMKKDKRLRRKTPSLGETGKQNHGDCSQARNFITAFDATTHEKPSETDGRRFNLQHDRPLDPWKLPPIDNLTKKGPVNLVLSTATNTGSEGVPATSTSDQLLMKSLRARARKLKKLERRQKKRKHHDRK